MKSRQLSIVTVVAALLLIAGPAFAHHSQAAYDTKNPVTLTGTVTEFLLVNPHAMVHFQVKDASGKVVEWMAEGATPNGLRKQGWTNKTIKPGDEITITGHPARSGRKEMHIVKVELDGKVLRDMSDLYQDAPSR